MVHRLQLHGQEAAQTNSSLHTQTSSLFTFRSACYEISSWTFTYSCVPRMGFVFSFTGLVTLRVLLWLIHARSFKPTANQDTPFNQTMLSVQHVIFSSHLVMACV